MSFVLTLVASDHGKPLDNEIIKGVTKIMGFYNVIPTCAPVWLEQNKAADLGITEKGDEKMISHMHEFLAQTQTDVFVTEIEKRRKKLLIADMDSTIVKGETLDELAEHAGLKDKIAEITQRAMDGELDFHEAIIERVGLLKGLSADALTQTMDTLETNPGAHTFIKTLRENSVICILVSGGFTAFTGPISKSLEFNNHHGNVLEIEDDELTGNVVPPILDKNAKVQFLNRYLERHNIDVKESMAIGDGANDLPMLEKAGLGIGYKPKKTVAEKIQNVILYGDLTAALYAQGYIGPDFYRIKETKI